MSDEMSDFEFDLVGQLIRGCWESEDRLYDAARNTQNRGLKVVLKSYAQQHSRLAEELHTLVADANIDRGLTEASSAFGRGWANLQAALTVRRQGRQRLVIHKALAQEEALLAHYLEARRVNLPAAAEKLLNGQIVKVRGVRDHLKLMAAPSSEQTLMVRLFDQAEAADYAVAELEQAGIAKQAVYEAPILQLEVLQENDEENVRSRLDTVLVSTILGGCLGGLLALLLIIAQRYYFPHVEGFFTHSPSGLIVELLSIGVLTGALYALIAGMLISEGASEDDAYLYEESLDQGQALVAVYTSPVERPTVERILGVKQQFEVEPQAA